MSIALQTARGKPIMPVRYRPSVQEGQYIRYRLNLAGKNLVGVSKELGFHRETVRKIVFGFSRSTRIEAEIARILGKADWNEVVLEARSEVQKKPVEVILQERQQAWEERQNTTDEAWANHRINFIEETDFKDLRTSPQRRGA